MKQPDFTPKFPPLASETRTHVSTECAAYHLGLSVNTLLSWSSRKEGLVLPMKRGGRLAWPVTELRRLCGEVQDGCAA